MLVELHVRNLGVIDDLTLTLGPGMTALTGETGAGKTLLVEAVELLVGGRADPTLVRTGSDLALVEGRFVADGSEVVVSREIPAEGRSRAYVDGRMATAAALAELGDRLVDLHGQHAHQSLLRTEAQRAALDRFGRVDTSALARLQQERRALEERLVKLGGDERSLAREVDLLRFQLAELDGAALTDEGEERSLEQEEEVLANAEDLKAAVSEAKGVLGPEEGARDLLGRGIDALGRHPPLADLATRLEGLAAELDDLGSELRAREERYEGDPERLEAVQQRRHLLAELRRKYGSDLAAVISYRDEARARLSDLEASEARRAELEAELAELGQEIAHAERAVGEARRRAAPHLSEAIETRLRTLALPRARLLVHVPGDGIGDAVEFRFGANAGEAELPLARVASGGELARAMLATRLVLTDDLPTLVFDEVDAGIGGQAALSVGRALAELAERHQVLVVTHLAQVAAFATAQVAIDKREVDGRTVTTASQVAGEERLIELSRMLSGQPESEAARQHARELLHVAASR